MRVRTVGGVVITGDGGFREETWRAEGVKKSPWRVFERIAAGLKTKGSME
jgi:hypothetical protein